jgi:hypothetical protein
MSALEEKATAESAEAADAEGAELIGWTGARAGAQEPSS